ncbi:biotin--[acetyl-CoA-carboxylase] ligase [Candidatus Bathyarchaeota archaeon RBG_13_46_16b]|nr:MAG: biotin--[acetyl-CoA-carboxylase] ligase [Candidatus Bathyarchaeota archaeon RBG_13_46_16b]
MDLNKLLEGLETKRVGRSVFFKRSVASTNSWARRFAGLGACDGTVFLAETQTAGRGRLKRRWISPAGGLWFSVVLRPKLKPTEAFGLVFVASLAVAEVLEEFYGLKTQAKWPNDVLVNAKKICGILAETKLESKNVEHVVVGVGINANFGVKKFLPEDLWKTATSLKDELGRKIELEMLLKALLEKLERLCDVFLEKGFSVVLDEWKKYAGFLGRQVKVVSMDERLTGLALDVDNSGSLVLKLGDGTVRHVVAGDVVLRSE